MPTHVDVPTQENLVAPSPEVPLTPQNAQTELSHFSTWIAYVYLFRVPLLVGLSMFLILPFLATHGLRALLQNLFVLGTFGTFATTVVALTLCWSLLLTSRLVLLNGNRFRLKPELELRTLRPGTLLFVVLFAVYFLLTQFLERRAFGLDNRDILMRVAAIVGGAIVAYLLAYIAVFVSLWIAPQELVPQGEKFPAPGILQSRLKWAEEHGLKRKDWEPLGRFLKKHLPENVWIGYLDPKDGVPWGGHWLALTFSIATIGVTLLLDVYRNVYQGESWRIPAICYVLTLALNLNWILSFFAFLLDRYRIPLLIPIAVLCTIGGNFNFSDHFYRTSSPMTVGAISPYEVLHARQGRPVILVATAGGGIQAGAWTAEVLSGLQDLSRNTWKTKNSFADCLTLVSSVSGGATGSMFFLNLYGEGPQAPFQDGQMARMKNDVKDSSLEDIAWALAYQDFARIILPIPSLSKQRKFLDRGLALEETWYKRGGIKANLADWRAGVKEGNRPAVIFNSTVSETGEPLLLSTTDLAEDTKSPRRLNFYKLYDNTDLPVVTAVRLAATFPYVSPAARRDSGQPEYHMIDGGYYDNPGVSSLVEWLDEGLEEIVKRNELLPEHILIIQIRSFPDEQREPKPKKRGWFFQTFAPIKGLLSVRTTGQLVHDHDELAKLARLWHSSDKVEQGLLQDRIRFATFTFNGDDAPLSWAMNKSQKDAIPDRWQQQIPALNKKDLAWVHCTLDVTSEDCRSGQKNGPY